MILKIYISQGSVATQLRCGGTCSNQFMTNFPQNVPVKKFCKSVNSLFGKDVWLSFLAHPVEVGLQVMTGTQERNAGNGVTGRHNDGQRRLGGTTGSASDQRSEGCGFEVY